MIILFHSYKSFLKKVAQPSTWLSEPNNVRVFTVNLQSQSQSLILNLQA